MEKEGLIRCLKNLEGVQINELITDMHIQIRAMFNVGSKFPVTQTPMVDCVEKQSLDMWHVCKSKIACLLYCLKYKENRVIQDLRSSMLVFRALQLLYYILNKPLKPH